MQQVRVKEIKAKTGKVKTGARAGQDYELVIIIGEDGSEFTTFDTAIKEVSAGGLLELEAEIKNNKTNITSFKILEKGTAPPPGSAAPTNGMTPEAWAEKDRLERWSRECNTCFMGIMQYASAPGEGPETEKYVKVFNVALDWAMEHFTGKPAPAAKSEKPAEKPVSEPELDFENLGNHDFKNAGEFLTALAKVGITRADAVAGLSINDISEVTDFNAAWATLTKKATK